MSRWWKEIWSTGIGASRVYCGIARTVDGYAVDLFRGDECLASDIYDTRAEAERSAQTLERRHVSRPSGARVHGFTGSGFTGSRVQGSRVQGSRVQGVRV
jgi:hypothetical protein